MPSRPGKFFFNLSHLSMPEPDAPALRPDGTLKDASEIDWIHSPSDETRPLASERAFSSAGLTDDIRRNHTETEAFGKMQI